MALVYEACRTSPLKHGCVHDPDSKVYYSFRYRAPLWTASTEKKEAFSSGEIGDIVRPSTPNGFYYECVSGGITGSTEPVNWSTVKDALTTDNDVSWKAIPDDMMIRAGDTLSSSIWESDDVGLVMDNDNISGFDTFVRVTAVPVDSTLFSLRNVITITRADGKVEEFNRTIKVKVKEQ